MNLSMTLRQIARRLPSHPAIASDTGVVSYGAFDDAAGRIAASLLGAHNVPPGAHIGIAMENCTEFLLALYGIWRAGMTAVPIDAKLHAKEMAFILSDARCRLCLCTPEIAGNLTALATAAPLPAIVATGTKDFSALLRVDPLAEAEDAPHDAAWLFYTSGTTGRPKGAVLSHRNLLFAISCYYAGIDALDERDVMIHAAPLSHGSGLYGLAHIAKGSHQIVLSGSFDPDRIFDLLGSQRNVAMFAAPTMVKRLIDHGRAGTADTRGLKTLVYGGAPMYVSDLKKALEIFGPKLTQIYGQGESPMTITYMPKAMLAGTDHSRYEDLLASCGFAHVGVEVKIAGEDGRALAPGEAGEVVTRSDCVMQGYWNNPEATANALRDGWLWTGDVGFLDGEGYLTLKDRSKDLIVSGGSNIYPREIEEVLLTHPAVLECAVVGRPHPVWGEEVVAFIVARSGADVTSEALDRLCLDSIARFKRPRVYRFVTELPKNNYGKILKTDLRQALQKETEPM